jgi:branched-chain amino acid transport system ATP-binding protein
MLRVAGLNAWYGQARILYDIALEVERGEVVALMGRNGAGKSTTLKAIMGLMERTRGDVRFRGQAVSALAPHCRARLGLGYVPEDRRIFKRLTVTENLTVGTLAPREGAPRWTLDALFELFPNLSEIRDRLGGSISGGEQQMLAVARTLMGNPRLVLLDEPSEGIAPKIVEQMAHAIVALKKEGLSVLVSEQNLGFAQWVSDRAYLIEKGHIQYRGTINELSANEELQRAYLTM